jgi:hypothetical protein
VAAMPSVSLIRKLTVLGVALAGLGVSTSSASASDVWLWTCHGPSGTPISDGLGQDFANYGAGCGAQGSDLGSGGQRGTLTPDATTGAFTYNEHAAATFNVPAETTLTGVRIQRRASGVVANMKYSLTAPSNQVTLESATGADVAAADQSFTVAPSGSTGGSVGVSLACVPPTGCPTTTGPATLDVSRLGISVSDTTAPTFAVGGSRSPVAGDMVLDIRANDGGVGLRYAQAFLLQAQEPIQKSFTATNCADMTPDDAVVDLPLVNDCKHVDNIGITVPTAGVADGYYTLVVRVADWAGNVGEQTSTVEVNNNVNLGKASQTLSIGTSDNTPPNVVANTNNGGKTGVAGQSSQNCTTPRLSFSLSQKPSRISKGVPVLVAGKRYRFNGRLTCVINKKRRSAPKGARVELMNKIGKKTYTKTGTTVRSDGKLTIILSYKTSRTLIFRFTNSDGKRSQVSIKVKVEKKKSSKR